MSLRYTIDSFRSYTRARIVETGESVEVNSRDSTARAFWKRRDQLGLPPPPNTDACFENALCEALPPDRACRECRFVGDDAPVELQRERSFGLAEVWRFVKAMAAWTANGCTLVPQAEAERRASICAQCPRNIEVPACLGCNGVAAALEAITSRSTSQDDRLKGCELCGCVNKIAVHFPLETVDKSVLFPQWCWKADAQGPQ